MSRTCFLTQVSGSKEFIGEASGCSAARLMFAGTCGCVGLNPSLFQPWCLDPLFVLVSVKASSSFIQSLTQSLQTFKNVSGCYLLLLAFNMPVLASV